MLVVMVSIHFLFSRPTVAVVLASRDGALPGTRMRLLMLCEVTWSLKFLVATRLTALLGGQLLRGGVLLTTSHGSLDLLLIL